MDAVPLRRALLAAGLAYLLSGFVLRPELDADLVGKVALITGGSRGSGRGFAQGLSAAGATVYITGRSMGSLEEACRSVPGPGRCVPEVVDSADDASLERFFAKLGAAHERLDILVNNAYSGVGYWRKHQLLGKPFWEAGMGLFDAVHSVGVRSHYKATLLAMPMLRRQAAGGRGLIVNTNSAGCLVYLFNVPYGMGKCAIDKMTAGMATELVGEPVDVVSWWAEEPMQTEEVAQGGLEGTRPGRGAPPIFGHLLELQGVSFQSLFHTALAGTLYFEGKVLSAFARDPAARRAHSGLAVMTGQLAQHYGVVDERGVRSPQFTSLKYLLTMFLPPLRRFAELPNPATLGGPPTATLAQRVFFQMLPDIHLPVWLFKLLAGNPLTSQVFL